MPFSFLQAFILISPEKVSLTADSLTVAPSKNVNAFRKIVQFGQVKFDDDCTKLPASKQ